MEVVTRSIERKIKSIIPSNIKKIAVNLLCNSFFGKALKKLGIRYNLFGGYFDYSQVSDVEAAKIFWGAWESAEIRFSKKYADCETIIELGSSVGVTLGVLAANFTNKRFICVEASTKNFEKLTALSQQLRPQNDYILINKAVAYGVDEVCFSHTTTTGSKIGHQKKNSEDYIAATTLKDIVAENGVKGKFSLITDIEGAEASIFFEDEVSLENCDRIIAELEDTDIHTIEQQINKLTSIGFDVVERYANVVVMSR